jgi:hypothetical protein
MMDTNELRAAFRAGSPVRYQGMAYSRISAIIIRRKAGRSFLQAELADKNGNSFTIARPDWIEKAGCRE